MKQYLLLALFPLMILVAPLLSATDNINEEAFEVALQRFSPLTPAQIDTVFKTYQDRLAQQSIVVDKLPNPVISTRSISLAPGSEIPLVRLCQGYITTLVFMDETGQPWPISNYSLGNPNAFDIVWDQKSNTMFIQSLNAWSFANIGIRLAGLNTPIMLNLVSSQGDIDYRIDFSLPNRGPLAKDIPHARGSSIVSDQKLFAYLDDTPPSYAVSLVVDPVHAQAWMEGEWMILRTKDLLISPSWFAQTMSSDGTKVYKLRPANTIVLSRDGAARTIQIKGC